MVVILSIKLTGVRTSVPLQIKRIVEPLAAERAEVPLDVGVTLHVPIQKALEGEGLIADATAKRRGAVIVGDRGHFDLILDSRSCANLLVCQRVLDTVAAIDKFELDF